MKPQFRNSGSLSVKANLSNAQVKGANALGRNHKRTDETVIA
jgi:hypothetical protein